MNRVGRKRKVVAERNIDIYNAIVMLTNKKKDYASVTAIANHIGMNPSTHLYNLCKQLAIEDEIDMNFQPSSRPQYKFYISDERKRHLKNICLLPWDCRPVAESSVGACVDGDGKACPVYFDYVPENLPE